jgi:hypothetical protein
MYGVCSVLLLSALECTAGRGLSGFRRRVICLGKVPFLDSTSGSGSGSGSDNFLVKQGLSRLL